MKYKQSVQIKVTQAHIVNGVMKSCRKCPLALAIAECVPTDVCVAVHSSVNLQGPRSAQHPHGYSLWTLLPKEAARFIEDFDNLDDVTTFEFLLSLPKYAIAKGIASIAA